MNARRRLFLVDFGGRFLEIDFVRNGAKTFASLAFENKFFAKARHLSAATGGHHYRPPNFLEKHAGSSSVISGLRNGRPVLSY